MRSLLLTVLFLFAALVTTGHCQHASTTQKLESNQQAKSSQLFELLDGNFDGKLDPFEALDVLLEMEAEHGNGITLAKALETIAENKQLETNEISEMLARMDANKDGKTELDEIDGPMRGFVEMRDANRDGIITLEEALNNDTGDPTMILLEAEIRNEVASMFSELDENQDGVLTKNEAEDEEMWAELDEGDSNRDGRVTKPEPIAFLKIVMSESEQAVTFEIAGDMALMTGVIGPDTPAKVLRLAFVHPSVRKIEMVDVPGSMDDEANVRAARYVRHFGFTTVLKSGDTVASGGTDFFLAGKKRIIENGAMLGIHSWGGPGYEGKDVPKDDPEHQLYLKYYKEMGIPSEFYWRTLEAAPENDIHWMTEDELKKFNFRTDNESVPNRPKEKPESEKQSSARKPIPESDSDIKSTRVTRLTDQFPKKYGDAFDRYVQVIAPNGKPINIFAQKEITDAQLRHVRDVMLHYLASFPESKYGVDKSKIANRMADNGAQMVILKGSDGEYREPRINAQPLYATETIVEGTAAYINNEFEEHRDATLEEVLHCVHDNGIGVDVRGAPRGVLPEFQKEIRSATTHAMTNGIWPTENSEHETSEWIEELREEGSLTQEYLASVIDSYYGLWGPFDEDFGMWGIYIARTRTDIQKKDLQGLSIVEKFFHPFLTYEAEIDSSFDGTFSMTFDSKTPYTHKSQYLLHARLTGKQNSNLTGNASDNRLAGNSGNNVFDGRGGKDTVVYPRAELEYEVNQLDDGTTIVVGDGKDKLINIERIVFDGAKQESQCFVEPVANRK